MSKQYVDFLSLVENAKWAKVEASPIEGKRYGVLLGKHAPQNPERFREQVTESYLSLVERYGKSISLPSDEIPALLQEYANRLYGSMLIMLESIPDPSKLEFEELVQIHDLLLDKFAPFSQTGNLIKERETP